MEPRLIAWGCPGGTNPQKPTQEISTNQENLREMPKNPFDQPHNGRTSNHLVFCRTQGWLSGAECILRLFVRLMLKPFYAVIDLGLKVEFKYTSRKTARRVFSVININESIVKTIKTDHRKIKAKYKFKASFCGLLAR